jgi:hypothetical protein
MSLKDTIQGLVDTLLKVGNGNNATSAQDVSDSVALILDNLTNLGSNYYGEIIPSSAAISEPAEGATVLPLEDGTYTNFNGLIKNEALCIFIYESSAWVKKTIYTTNKPKQNTNYIRSASVNVNDVLDSNLIAEFKEGFYLDAQGKEVVFSGYSYAENYTLLNPLTQYNYIGRISASASLVFYNKDKEVVGYHQDVAGSEDFDFTTPKNTMFGRFSVLDSRIYKYQIKSLEAYNINELDPLFNQVNYSKSSIGNLDVQDINTDYCHLVAYGQSLSVGFDNPAAFTISPLSGNYMVGSTPDDHIGTAKTSLINTDKEHFITATTNSFSKLYRRFVNKSQEFFASSTGQPGATVAQLSKAGQPHAIGVYENFFISALTRAKAIADAEVKTISCPAILYLQGESDYDLIGSNPTSSDADKTIYKTRLLQLKNDMQYDIMSTYGQESKPLFLIYQVGGDFAKNKELQIDVAQIEFAEENEDVILMNPNYFTPDYEGAHLSINGYRWYGEQCAKTLYQTLVKGDKFQSVFPKKYTIVDNKILIDFYVPVPPLVFDNKILEDLEDKGFYIYQNGSRVDISAIELYNNRIILKVKNNLIGSIEIGYGSATVDEGYGNLRDSDLFRSLYGYEDDVLDYSTTARGGKWQELTYVSGSPAYVPGNTYALGDKVEFTRIDGLKLVESLSASNNTVPFYEIAYRPLTQIGTTLIGQKYPMYNWCNQFYKLINI